LWHWRSRRTVGRVTSTDSRVCGQSVLANKIDPKTVQPEIELDLWALTTLVNLQSRGYIKVGEN
jgi:hypothetical protein